MPLIHIRSLALDPMHDVAAVITGLSKDYAAAAKVDIKHVSVTWTMLPPGHYAAGGKIAHMQPEHTHAMLVELLRPRLDLNESEALINKLLGTIADSLSKRADVSRDNIFIVHRYAESGQVFGDGEVVRWESVDGRTRMPIGE